MTSLFPPLPHAHVLFALCSSCPSLPRPYPYGQACFESWCTTHSTALRHAARTTYARLWPIKGQLNYHELIDENFSFVKLTQSLGKLFKASKKTGGLVVIHLVAYGSGDRISLWDTTGSTEENGLSLTHLAKTLAAVSSRTVFINDTGAAIAAHLYSFTTISLWHSTNGYLPDNTRTYFPSSPTDFFPRSAAWLSAVLRMGHGNPSRATPRLTSEWLRYWGVSVTCTGPDLQLAGAPASYPDALWSMFDSLWQTSDQRVARRAKLDFALSLNSEAPDLYVALLQELEESFDFSRSTHLSIPAYEEERAAALRAALRNIPGAGKALCAAAHKMLVKLSKMLPCAYAPRGAYNLAQLAHDIDESVALEAQAIVADNEDEAKKLLLGALQEKCLSAAGLAMLVRLIKKTNDPVKARVACQEALHHFTLFCKDIAEEAHGLFGRLIMEHFPEDYKLAAHHLEKGGPAFKDALDSLLADCWAVTFQEIRTPRTHRAAGLLHDGNLLNLVTYISALDHKAQDGPPLHPLPDSLLWLVADCLRWAHDQPVVVAGGHGVGSGPMQLGPDLKMAVTSTGDVYISDAMNHRVQCWPAGSGTSRKRALIAAGGNGAGAGHHQLNSPRGIAVKEGHAAESVAIADSANHRVMLWEGGKSGTLIAGGNGQGARPDQLDEPVLVAFEEKTSNLLIGCESGRVVRWPRGGLAGVTIATMAWPDVLCGISSSGEILATSQCKSGLLPLWPAHRDRQSTQMTVNISSEVPDDWPQVSVDPETGMVAALIWPVVLCWSHGEWDDAPRVVFECTDDHRPCIVVRRGVVYLCFDDGRGVAFHAATAPRS